jgi:hypothetical protein
MVVVGLPLTQPLGAIQPAGDVQSVGQSAGSIGIMGVKYPGSVAPR